MPRKNCIAGGWSGRSTRCFNEAAARCRGKTVAHLSHAPGRLCASMRPRPDAAEKLEHKADANAAEIELQ